VGRAAQKAWGAGLREALSGAFNKENEAQTDLWIGEFHAEMALDDGEKIRASFPEAISLPTEHATYLLCDSQYLLAGHISQ
jgi:hypothetical protein